MNKKKCLFCKGENKGMRVRDINIERKIVDGVVVEGKHPICHVCWNQMFRCIDGLEDKHKTLLP